MCEFRDSDLVECVDNSPVHQQSKIMPELDRLYKVESIRWLAGGYSIRLEGLPPTCFKGGCCACGECGWDARRFRHVYRPEPRKLASLTALLQSRELISA